MSEQMNRSRSQVEYEWSYEYYDDEEPVSFEELRANRYSIVIGFWVGLAVFVIFMFFVLTLLTKTGAPHPELSDVGEKHHGLSAGVLELSESQAFSLPPLPEESRSLFHFYLHEDERPTAHRDAVIGRGRDSGRGSVTRLRLQDETGNEDEHFLSNFNIPNFVNSEQSSSVANDDFLLCEPSIITGSQSDTLNGLEPAHLSYDVIRH